MPTLNCQTSAQGRHVWAHNANCLSESLVWVMSLQSAVKEVLLTTASQSFQVTMIRETCRAHLLSYDRGKGPGMFKATWSYVLHTAIILSKPLWWGIWSCYYRSLVSQLWPSNSVVHSCVFTFLDNSWGISQWCNFCNSPSICGLPYLINLHPAHLCLC